MSCEHPLSQIVVKDGQVLEEKIFLNPCPYCQLKEIDKYFTSCNSIPVERATILSRDYWKIRGISDEH